MGYATQVLQVLALVFVFLLGVIVFTVALY